MDPIEDVDVPRSPGWWLQKLAVQLHERRRGVRGRDAYTRRGVESSKVRPGLELLDDYLRGDPPLRPDIHGDWSAPFRQFLRMGRLNVAPLLVSSTSSRLAIRDFRTSAGDDDLGDVEARKIMRANQLSLRGRDSHDRALGHGDAYVIVTPPDVTRPRTLITDESALHCVTAHDHQGRTVASLKMFRDEHDDVDWAYLMLTPDPSRRGELWVARAQVKTSTLFGRGFNLTRQWEWDTEKCDDLPSGRNPMVRLRNKDGRSELEGYIDTLDRINDKLFNEWWIGKIQAFRQRAVKLKDTAEDQDDEQLVEQVEELLESTPDVNSMSADEISNMFTTAPDGFWTLPIGAEVWESTPTDITSLTNTIKAELQWLAAVKSLPLHTVTPDAANGSAEGASTMREEHVFTIEDRADRFEPAWVEIMSLAFEYEGDIERSDVSQLEVIWAPFERYSLEQKADAASKLKGILPSEVIMTDYLQMAPADVVERVRPARSRELLYGALPAARPTPTAAPTTAATS